MENRILVVIHDRDMREFVQELLDDYFDEQASDVVIDTAKNVKEARKRTAGNDYRAIVVHLHIATDRKATLVEEEMLGLDFLQKLNGGNAHTPCVLLTPIVNNDILSNVNGLPSTFPLIVGEENWEEQIVEQVRQAFKIRMSSISPEDNATRLKNKIPGKINLDIFVDAQQKNWTMVAKGVGDVICDPKPHVATVNIDRDRVQKQDERVFVLREDHPHWEDQLQEIGENLVLEIIENDPSTLNFYQTLRGKAGGSENFNIRFSMDEKDFFLPVEAILEPDHQKQDDFWMLKAPICRRVEVQSAEDMWPLFEDERQGAEHKQINCLIIEADVEGYNEKIDGELKKLDNVKIEADSLKELLKKNRTEYQIGEIKCLPDDDTPCTKAKVREILTSGQRWDLVHYAGHSYHRDSGYVFFPGDPTFQEVDIEKFGHWLRQAKTRLVYLSSCKSSKVQFVQKLTRIGVPSVLGFRWDIDDRKAADHAQIFYQKLFAERSLEYAFLKTRQKVHEKNPQHIIWAAPVLVMQARS